MVPKMSLGTFNALLYSIRVILVLVYKVEIKSTTDEEATKKFSLPTSKLYM